METAAREAHDGSFRGKIIMENSYFLLISSFFPGETISM